MSRLSAFAALNEDSDDDVENREMQIEEKEDGLSVEMFSGDVLSLGGTYTVKVLTGSVAIDGYTVTSSIGVNASAMTSPPAIRVSPACTAATLRIENGPVLGGIATLYAHARTLFPTGERTFSHEAAATSLPSDWASAIDSILSCTATSAVLTLGNKNTGKSTFSKILANSLISAEPPRRVVWLDLDPGQPELSLPGCISLTEVTEPLVGTVFPWEREREGETTTTKYIGFSSPSHQPLYYLRQLDALLDTVNSLKNTVTIINSPGWVKGFGEEIISHLVSRVHISHLVQLSNNSRDLDIIHNIRWNDTKIIKLASVPTPPSTYPPSTIRAIKLLSYMHYTPPTYNFTPLLAHSPYIVSYTTSKETASNAIQGFSIFDHPFSYTPNLHQSLECQFMAIITIPKSILETTPLAENTLTCKNSPNFINESLFHSLSDHTTFHGLALIHSIDTTSRTFNLYTPLNPSSLKCTLSENALFLIKGREDVPIEELFPLQLQSTSYWSSFALDALPYISTSLSNDVIGGKTSNIRRNIQRR